MNMAKKSELVSAINSYSTARATGDNNLINMSGSTLQRVIDTIEFEEETVAEAPPTEAPEAEDAK